MKEKNGNSRKINIGKYLSEIVAIFLGISITFWFDEWRGYRKDREMEQTVLNNLKENLAQDTFVLGGTIAMAENMIKGTEKLVAFKEDQEIIDSVSIFIDLAASYTAWLVNQTTYEEIKQTGKTTLIQNDTLKKAILGHYTGLVPYVKEWCEIDKTHTMSYLIPEMSNYFPVVIDTLIRVTPAQKVKYLKTPKIKYLLSTSVTYKKEAVKALKMANGNIKRLIGKIDRALK
jgi:Family of unknown function (DUF6090)